MKHEENYVGALQSEPKKKTRRTKKQVEKDLMMEYNEDKKDNESLLNKSYNMMQYLSSREKKKILRISLQNQKMDVKKTIITYYLKNRKRL